MKLHYLFTSACFLVLSPLAREAMAYPVNLPSGYSTIANQLVNSTCLDGVASGPWMPGTTVYRYDPYVAGFIVHTLDPDFMEWDLMPCLLYGEGAIVNTPTPYTVTFNGTPYTEQLPLSGTPPPGVRGIVAGVNLLARQSAHIGTFESILGRPPSQFGSLQMWELDPAGLFLNGPFNSTPAKYFTYQNLKWAPYPPQLRVGEGIWLKIPSIPTGPVPTTCQISGVNPAKDCRGVTVNLTNYGMNFPLVGPQIRLTYPPCGGILGPFPAAPLDPLDPGYILTTSFFLPNSACAGNWNVEVLDQFNNICATLPGGFTVQGAPCAQPYITVRLLGPALVAPNVVNRFALYYKNLGASAPSAKFRITCLPNPAQATITPITAPFTVYTGVTPCGAARQTITNNPPISVPSGAEGYILFDMTVLQAPVFNFTISASSYRIANSAANDSDTLAITTVASQDPNDKVGLAGVAAPRYISGKDTMPYQVMFENKPNATAPAQKVVVTDRLDPNKFDFASFSLGPITFGNQIITPPSGLKTYSTSVPFDVDGNPNTTADDITVQIDASLNMIISDPNFGQVTWKFQSIDPLTGLPPTDPLRGFLPPNTSAPNGQGSVYFSIDPFSNLAGGDTITNGAVIVFDTNPSIDTPIWLNTIDLTELRLQIVKEGDSAVVSWTGHGHLQSATDLGGDWQDVIDATTPYTEATKTQKFYRLKQ